MGRPKKIDQTKRVEVQIPESVISLVELELWSELELKVPFGKMSELVTGLLRTWLVERGIVA